jgi:hypothetical protein
MGAQWSPSTSAVDSLWSADMAPSAPKRFLRESSRGETQALGSANRATSLSEFGERKLSLLCEGLGLSHQRAGAIGIFRVLTRDWGHWPIGAGPVWQNDITDDSSPFEFSVAFGAGAPQLRILVESQQLPMGPGSTWSAGLALNERLELRPGVDLTRFDRVSDLFAPSMGTSPRFDLWHAAALNADGSAAFKLYLNPQVGGHAGATAIVCEALRRLSMNEALEFLMPRMTSARANLSPLYVSLDLSLGQEARVKVYVAHEDATAADVNAALEGCVDNVPGDASHWLKGMLGGAGPFGRRPMLICYAFSTGAARPRATLHVPVRSYVRSDEEALGRACQFLGARRGGELRSGLTRMTGRPLNENCGVLTYVSFRRSANDVAISAYIAPHVYARAGRT